MFLTPNDLASFLKEEGSSNKESLNVKLKSVELLVISMLIKSESLFMIETFKSKPLAKKVNLDKSSWSDTPYNFYTFLALKIKSFFF